jgi:hypothetical protein
MDKIQVSLDRFKKNTNLKINPLWEEAKEFGEYVGLPTKFVLRLFKVYDKKKVLGLRSWLKDAPHDPKRFAGLVVWKLKNPLTK